MPVTPATRHPEQAEETPELCLKSRPSLPEGSVHQAVSEPVLKCSERALSLADEHESGDPLLGATIAGRFTILGRLGRGSMGAVYRARQEAVGREVALKIVRPERSYDPETKARFEREARAISLLTSQHTITAFDFGEAEDGSWFLAMEMLEGESVGDRLRRKGRIEWRDAVRFVREALRSLGEAHAKGIVHRDLKPDNLFLALSPDRVGLRREICKVLDFGIVKWQRPEHGKIDQLETQAGTVFGTPRYMSPEQAQGAELDGRSDLYSLGVLLYQMLTGHAPFVDDDAVVVMARHIKDLPPAFKEVAPQVPIPPPIEALVRRALAKSPHDRPRTAEQMSIELARAVEQARSLESGIRPILGVVNRRSGFSPWLFAFGLAGGLLAVLTVLGWRWLGMSNRRSVAHPPISTAISTKPRSLADAERVTSQPLVHEKDSSNSASPTASSPQPAPRARRLRTPASPVLIRKGNERYGRFD